MTTGELVKKWRVAAGLRQEDVEARTNGEISQHPRVHARSGTLEWAIKSFLLDARARDLSEETLDFYRRKLRPFVEYAVELGVARTASLQTRHLQGYLIHLRTQGQSPANINSHSRALRALLHWLVENDMADPELPRYFRRNMPQSPQVARRYFTPEEIGALLKAAGNTPTPERDTALLMLMADTGLRAGEIGRITEQDCEPDRILIHGKGRKERYVPLAPTTRKAVAKWRRKRGESDWLFVTVRDEPMSRQTVYKLFQRLGEACGIDPCHPHMMRRSTAREWIKAGGDTFSLQDLLGHSTQTMSRVYVDLANDDVVEKHRTLSLVERLGKRRR